MAELKNEFSWSKSRDELFRECQRKYYYNYYGYWDGWKDHAEPKIKKLYILKNLQTGKMWLGSLVHTTIEDVLKKVYLNRTISKEEAVKNLTNQMYTEYKDSEARRYKINPKKFRGLFEHHYGIRVRNETWRRLRSSAIVCVENFFKSRIFEQANILPKKFWLPIEDFSRFQFEETKIYVKLDFALKTDDQIIIVDWKTGEKEDVDLTIQMGCYFLYAQSKWEYEPSSIEAVEVNLNRSNGPIEKHHKMVEAKIDWLKHYIRNSILGMKMALRDPNGNLAIEEDFVKTDSEETCKWCNFKEVCNF